MLKTLIRIIPKASNRTSCKPLFRSLELLTLPSFYMLEILKFVHKNSETLNQGYNTRIKEILSYPITINECWKPPIYIWIKMYNKIDELTKQLNYTQFDNLIKKHSVAKSFLQCKRDFGG